MPSSCIFVMLSSDNKNQIRSKVCYPLSSLPPSHPPSPHLLAGSTPAPSFLPFALASCSLLCKQPLWIPGRRERFIVHFASFWAHFCALLEQLLWQLPRAPFTTTIIYLINSSILYILQICWTRWVGQFCNIKDKQEYCKQLYSGSLEFSLLLRSSFFHQNSNKYCCISKSDPAISQTLIPIPQFLHTQRFKLQ